MDFLRNLGLFAAIVTLVACGDDSSGSGGATGGAPAAGGSGSGGQPTGDGGAGGAAIGALTHCEPPAFHCQWATGFYGCAEYAQADAPDYQSLCEDGDGAWASGHCDETGAIGACLPLNYCMGMGIGYLYDSAQLTDAQASCSSTGGTWEEPAP